MHELTIAAKIENTQAVVEFVNRNLEALGCQVRTLRQLDIAVDELFSNIARYAYESMEGSATVRVEVTAEPLAVVITFIDEGVPYDPLAKEDPDVTLTAAERNIGGLGIYIVKKSMDQVDYEYKEGRNILRIKKSF